MTDTSALKLAATLAILTWRSPKTLQQTLESLSPIAGFFSERLVVCQESDPEEIAMANAFGYTAHALAENLGIQHGLKAAVELSQQEQVLLLENDTALQTSLSLEQITQLLSDIHQNLRANRFSCVRLRFIPGEMSKKAATLWRISGNKVSRTWLGYLRPKMANSVYAELTYQVDPSQLDTSKVKQIQPFLYQTDSRYIKWMNAALFLNRSFFLNQIIPFAESHPTSRLVNGLPELEHRINSRGQRSWWIQQRFAVGFSVPALFGHHRIDRPVQDEKGYQ